MGDRISFSFTNRIDNSESIAFFDHWGGKSLLESVNDYLSYLTDFLKSSQKGISTPLSRLRPDTVMLDFIRWYFLNKESIQSPIESSYYLGKDENDGDNSDNGHHKFELADYIIDSDKKSTKKEWQLIKMWKTKEGYIATILEVFVEKDHFCGYIGVRKDNIFYGKDYCVQNDAILLDFIYAHKGIDYTNNENNYPVYNPSKDIFWLGFSCHYDSDTKTDCNLAYCTGICNNMSRQIKRINEMYKRVDELIYLPGGLEKFLKLKHESDYDTTKLLSKLFNLSLIKKR